ncbi:hypothetical protein HDV02_005974, partial [Globomyces sp. JEL0801]
RISCSGSDQMAEVSNYYGTNPVFGIGSTGREWHFFKLHRDESCEIDDSCLPPDTFKSKELDACSPATGNIDSLQYDSDDIEQTDGNIQKGEGRRLIGTRIYKWDDQEMLFMVGSVLKEMSLFKMTQR